MNTACILFAHGARDPQWAAPLLRLADVLRAAHPGVSVLSAYLEFMGPQLPEAIDSLVADGVERICVVPVFLAQGGHVKRDLPAMLEAARQRHPGVQIDLCDAVGEDPGVIAAMAEFAGRHL